MTVMRLLLILSDRQNAKGEMTLLNILRKKEKRDTKTFSSIANQISQIINITPYCLASLGFLIRSYTKKLGRPGIKILIDDKEYAQATITNIENYYRCLSLYAH